MRGVVRKLKMPSWHFKRRQTVEEYMLYVKRVRIIRLVLTLGHTQIAIIRPLVLVYARISYNTQSWWLAIFKANEFQVAGWFYLSSWQLWKTKIKMRVWTQFVHSVVCQRTELTHVLPLNKLIVLPFKVFQLPWNAQTKFSKRNMHWQQY